MNKIESATVLVVDDDPVITNIVAEQISLFGYQPVMASSGKEALKIASRETKIDLLLTDVMMPEMNGVELARQIVTMFPEIKILFMSGYICPSIAQYGIQDSEHAYLQKPFTQNKLITKMRNVLVDPTIDI